MKTMKKQLFKKALLFMGVVMFALISCKKEEDPAPDPIASFQYEISATNYLQVTFTSFSQNAVSFAWKFGDGTTSTEQNPTHTYTDEGDYTVELIVKNADGVSSPPFEQSITIADPDKALKKLTGEVSKTWKLLRVGTTLGVGPNAGDPYSYWDLENDGKRPCIFYHEFTFGLDGSFVFDDKGAFWGEVAVFSGTAFNEVCFEAIAANMINKDGVDVSAWLSGSHTFEYNPSTGMVTLNGIGAWMGLPQLTTEWDQITPVPTKSFKITIEEHDGYDQMFVLYDQTNPSNPEEKRVWAFNYASYSNPALEPDVVTEAPPFGEDLPDITPDELYHTFESASSFMHIGAIGGTSVITVGEDDPTDAAATKVGKFVRVAAEWQEAQLRTTPDLNDIQFDNFNTVKIDIFVPASTVFEAGGLVRQFVLGFADMSQTEQWWNSPIQFLVEGDDMVIGAWTTYTFNLTDVKARNDLDMIYLGIGGGGHFAEGTFYIRNLIFE